MRQWMVDAFADAPFRGNPACVVEPFQTWPAAEWMQSLAAENNQAETAFLRKTPDPSRYALRWFTPALEVPLCGHATLASGHVIFSELGVKDELLRFETLSGLLTVSREPQGYAMDFPVDRPTQTSEPPGLSQALGATPLEVWAGKFLVAIFSSEADIRGLAPDLAAVAQISGEATGGRGNLAVAALAEKGSRYDVVDRFFAPGSGIPEDAATGSAHCCLAPLFAAKLGREALSFHQAYPGRGADIGTIIKGDRVILSGRAITIHEARLRLSV